MNKFKQIFGSAIGDFEQKKHMKYKEPIKGKEMKTLFRKNGYRAHLRWGYMYI
jgi:hypothetical protein